MVSARLLKSLACPQCSQNFKQQGSKLICANKHSYPVVGGIPRFVDTDKYVESFSLEWTEHVTTQYDTVFPSPDKLKPIFVPLNKYTKAFDKKWKKNAYVNNADVDPRSDTYNIIVMKLGFKPEDLKGKKVLDIGCGNGRFLDVLSKAGADCYGLDLSESVDSAHKNLGKRKNVNVVQADLNHPPFKEGYFDLVYSVGVLHHSPSTKKALQDIIPLTKKGGDVAIWVYGVMSRIDMGLVWRPFLNKLPLRVLYNFCKISVPLYYLYKIPLIGYVRVLFPIAMSPDPTIRVQGTFDSYSPKYVRRTTNSKMIKITKTLPLKNVQLGIFPISMKGKRV